MQAVDGNARHSDVVSYCEPEDDNSQGENGIEYNDVDGESQVSYDDDGGSQTSVLDDNGVDELTANVDGPALVDEQEGLSIPDYFMASKRRNDDFMTTIEVKRSSIICNDEGENMSHYNDEGESNMNGKLFFVLENCDWCAVLIHAVQQAGQGVYDLVHIDIVGQLIGTALETKMAVISSSKEAAITAAISSLGQKYTCVESRNCSLSNTLRTFAENKKSDDCGSERGQDSVLEAADCAAGDYDGSKDAKRYCFFSQIAKNVYANFMFVVAGARTMFLIKVGDFGRRLSTDGMKKWKGYMTFCESMHGRPVDELRLDQLYSLVLAQVIHDDSRFSLEDKVEAFKIADLIFKCLPSKAVNEWGLVEAIPITIAIQSCRKEELDMYKSNNKEPYFCQRDEDGELSDNSSRRRNVASRLLQQALLSRPLSQLLLRHGHEKEAGALFFGMMCVPQSLFARKNKSTGHKLLFDVRMYQMSKQKDYVELLLKKPVQLILEKVPNAIEVCSADTLFVDLTKDAIETIQLFEDFFEYLDLGGEHAVYSG